MANNSKRTTGIAIALVGIIPACLTAVLGYMQGAKDNSKLPPTVEIESAEEIAPAPVAGGWTYKYFKSGAEAASYLSLAEQQPLPTDVYATLYGSNVHVWWKPAKSGHKYSYRYVPWDGKEPQSIPLPRPNLTQIPMGFGRSGGKTVFVFFDESK
jgi:hypothetical protein